MSQKYLIINADDFGLCKAANDAVIDLFRSNCVFSSTVMMTCPGTEDAVKFAAENP
ncbi:MAG: ChbG/HpnK family deacetylase, partial [Clostridia bacterium]|nr:ChbG/HpnK family deacetylase [Clostridia bacterium]